MQDKIIVGVVLIMVIAVFGFIFLVVPKLADNHKEEALKKCTVRVDGTVTEIVQCVSTFKKENGSTVYVYNPVISYSCNGQEFKGEYADRYKSWEYVPVGTKVDVYVNPDNPAEIFTEPPEN